MLFHSWRFAIFFAVAYSIYLPLRKTRFYVYWLLAASYFFYASWNPLYLLLIGYSTVCSYYLVRIMRRSRRKKLWFAISATNSLVLLAFFKYSVFAANNINALLTFLRLPVQVPVPGMLFPVGISFYTFQIVSYIVDAYRGDIEQETSLVRYAAYVALFPRLLAGPIERAGNILPQLNREPQISALHITDGLSLFVVGLFKKIALADFLALYVDRVFSAPAMFDGLSLALAAFAFCWQIYFDFSGYTDMARGISRMMGFNLMLNFNNPYLATGLGDFWRRWHISLSTWFKDYVYIPLGGNRKGKFRTYVNMFVTMVVSGLWHGAAWTFVIWGALHALGRFATRELERTDFYNNRIPRIAKQLMVFVFVCFAWIFFRAESFGDAVLIVRRIFTAGFSDPRFPLLALFFCLAVWIYEFLFESRLKRILEWAPVRIALVSLMILYLFIFTSSTNEGFIYLQF